MEIRPARRGDDESLLALDKATISPDVTPASPGNPTRVFWKSEEDPANTLVADLDGAVVGYVKLRQATELESSRHVLHVAGLAVDPRHQGRGIGRVLMQAAIDEAERRGARRLTLRVLEPNKRAQRLYESLGFDVEGVQREEFFLDGRYVDDVLMALTLPAARAS
jgi:ribosomal protein S18 acetylase RimI-like enzyme